MRAALDDLAASASGRRVAVLGDMLELGPGEGALPRGDRRARARRAGVDLLVTVGPRAARIGARVRRRDAPRRRRRARPRRCVPDLLEPGDTVLVKASRGVGLEVVAQALETGTAV